MIKHTKNFGVYHWDTFDNKTILIMEFDEIADAKTFVMGRYGKRISTSGADKVDIVDKGGDIVEQYNVG